MAAQGINIWRPHPLEPECWFLGRDDNNALIPLNAPETMFLEVSFSYDYFFFLLNFATVQSGGDFDAGLELVRNSIDVFSVKF
jgi:hypothetical protein